jgi:hypothetical protein
VRIKQDQDAIPASVPLCTWDENSVVSNSFVLYGLNNKVNSYIFELEKKVIFLGGFSCFANPSDPAATKDTLIDLQTETSARLLTNTFIRWT